MTRLTMTFAALALLAAASSSAFAQGKTLPTSRMLARYGLERAWWSQSTLDIGQDRVRHMVLDEDSLFMQSSGGIVTAFNNETGQKRWAVQLGRHNLPSQACVTNDNQVLVIAGSTMYALQKYSGDLIWQLQLSASPSTSPSVDNQRIYYGTIDGSVYAYDLKKIEELHNDNLLPQWANVALSWRYKAAGEITTQPISNNLTLNFASRDNSLYALTPSTRVLQWQFETDRPVSAPLGHSPGFLYLASEDFNVFCIQQNTGSVRWQFVAGQPIRKQVRVVGDNVYVFPHRGGLYCLSRITGERRWWQPHMEDFVGSTKNILLVTDSLGQITALSPKDGAVIGSLPLKDFSVRYGNELTDRIYIATKTGLVVCFREQGKEFPTYHMFPERQPILPELSPDDAAADAADDTTASADGNAAGGGLNF
ncbi:MAG: PQQ-binding-like beta-propeller repeat protein [Planctomycetota bacterium]|nr:PQQ-binding-like beta-propeller repeat protein [Planctomycetota bacterium]